MYAKYFTTRYTVKKLRSKVDAVEENLISEKSDFTYRRRKSDRVSIGKTRSNARLVSRIASETYGKALHAFVRKLRKRVFRQN